MPPVNRKGTAFSVLLLRHIFLNEDIPGIGDASGLLGSSVAGNLYISLHYDIRTDVGAGPTPAIDQTTYEFPYTSGVSGGFTVIYGAYARVAVPRNAANWEISGTRIRNKNTISFPAQGPNRVSNPHDFIDPVAVGIGTAPSGTGKLLYLVPCLTTNQSLDQPTLADGTILPFGVEPLVINAGNLCVIEV